MAIKSRRGSRGLRCPMPTEADTLRAIIDFLEASQMPYIRVNPSSSGFNGKTMLEILTKVSLGLAPSEAYKKIKGMLFHPLRDSQLGAPDLIVYPGQGAVVHVEVKSPLGKQSQVQIEWEKRGRSMGLECILVRTIDGFLEYLNRARHEMRLSGLHQQSETPGARRYGDLSTTPKRYG